MTSNTLLTACLMLAMCTHAACPAAKLGPGSSELGLLVGSPPDLPAEEDPVQQSVEELFEDLSYEMAPVPCAGQELFNNVIKPHFGELSAGLTLPAAILSIEAIEVTCWRS